MATTLTLPFWYDLHVHVRQGALIAPLVAAHRAMGCAGILAMPNTLPPVANLPQIDAYQSAIRDAGGDGFDALIVPLYLTRDTTPEMIAQGAASSALQACKYYPPHGTTNAEHGAPLELFMENGVFAAMQEHGVVLCIHGEEHGLCAERYFARGENAEEIFYRERMPRLIEKFPALKIVGEHITTAVAAEFIAGAPDYVGATITPQHLLYTVGHLLQGLKYHLFCLPLVKFEGDRAALQAAVLQAGQRKFFAGTDSAPHTKKVTPCGCAAGCFTGLIAPQLYAMGFEAGGASLDDAQTAAAFKRFLCDNGRVFYGLPTPEQNFRLVREEAEVVVLDTPEGPVVPLPAGLNPDHEKTGTTLPWRLFV